MIKVLVEHGGGSDWLSYPTAAETNEGETWLYVLDKEKNLLAQIHIENIAVVLFPSKATPVSDT